MKALQNYEATLSRVHPWSNIVTDSLTDQREWPSFLRIKEFKELRKQNGNSSQSESLKRSLLSQDEQRTTRNWRVNRPCLRGKLLPLSDAGVKSMFKITLDIKGRNSVWASGVRRKSQRVRERSKLKPQSFQRTTDKLAVLCSQGTLIAHSQRQRRKSQSLCGYSLRNEHSWMIILFS